jgi:hypothetical protein
VGNTEGPGVGLIDGIGEGFFVGFSDGLGDGLFVGVFVGLGDGLFVGVFVGLGDGLFVGVFVGLGDGLFVGVFVGLGDGLFVGVFVGLGDGVIVGVFVGLGDGLFVGVFVGLGDGLIVGVFVGLGDGLFVGVFVGLGDGLFVGVFVGLGDSFCAWVVRRFFFNNDLGFCVGDRLHGLTGRAGGETFLQTAILFVHKWQRWLSFEMQFSWVGLGAGADNLKESWCKYKQISTHCSWLPKVYWNIGSNIFTLLVVVAHVEDWHNPADTKLIAAEPEQAKRSTQFVTVIVWAPPLEGPQAT